MPTQMDVDSSSFGSSQNSSSFVTGNHSSNSLLEVSYSAGEDNINLLGHDLSARGRSKSPASSISQSSDLGSSSTHVWPNPTENEDGSYCLNRTNSRCHSPCVDPVRRQYSSECTEEASRDGIYKEASTEHPVIVDRSTDSLSEKLDSTTSRSSESSRPEGSATPEGQHPVVKEKKDTRSEGKKKGKAWYNVLNPTYKSRSEDLKRLFKQLPSEERLIVDYSCALQKDILVHGRLYVTPNYFCFYSKIFGWETFVSFKCKDITQMTKEKMALVIPNAIQIITDSDRHFFTSFAARDKAYLMLFRIWQNALMEQQMSPSEVWQWVHSTYGEELGLTSDDDDYIPPSADDDSKTAVNDRARDTRSSGAPKSLQDVPSSEDLSQSQCQSLAAPSVSCKSPSPTLPPATSSHSLNGTIMSSMPADVPETVTPRKISPEGTPNIPLQQSTSLQTDSSDSTGSQDNIKGLALECVFCPDVRTHHIGREFFNSVFLLPIDKIFTFLFTKSKFMLDIHDARKTYNVDSSPWQSNIETNQKIRQVTYTVTLPLNSFGPKVSHVTETQVMSSFSKPGEIYTIDSEASNAGIPYADSFSISTHWCLTRETARETRMAVWSQVNYKKSVWGFMKGVIDRNAFSGIQSLIADLNTALLLEVDQTRRTKRRRRRAGSCKGGASSDLGDTPASTEMHAAPQIPPRKLTLPTIVTEQVASSEGPVLLVAGTLFILLILNILLYYRLWILEGKVVVAPAIFPSFEPTMYRLTSTSDNVGEWVRLLHQQEALHSAEVERWRKAVGESADLLRKAEECLRSLHSSIPLQHTSKIQALLQEMQSLFEGDSRTDRDKEESVVDEL